MTEIGYDCRMGNFSTNPLFRAATKELQDLARREFARSSVGQIAETVRQSKTRGTQAGRMIQRYAKSGPDEVLRRLAGTPFGSIVRQVSKYSRQGQASGAVIAAFLDQLGPIGGLVKALAGTSGHSRKRQAEELALAARLIRAFGGEAWLPKELTTTDDWNRGIDAARQRLEEAGYEVNQREIDTKHPLHEPSKREVLGPRWGPEGRLRKTVDVPLASGGTRRLPKNHPLVTGEMQLTPQSSNVYAFGYDLPSAILYVRFKQDDPDGGGKKNSPGSLYKYENVEPETALDMFKASSKGTWIWDTLRIRGTVSGHNYDYALVGISGGYVPRKAVMTPQGEAYKPRSIFTDQNQWRRSSRGFELVRPNGTPNRGTPNRGRPDTGKS